MSRTGPHRSMIFLMMCTTVFLFRIWVDSIMLIMQRICWLRTFILAYCTIFYEYCFFFRYYFLCVCVLFLTWKVVATLFPNGWLDICSQCVHAELRQGGCWCWERQPVALQLSQLKWSLPYAPTDEHPLPVASAGRKVELHSDGCQKRKKLVFLLKREVEDDVMKCIHVFVINLRFE